MAAPPTRSVPPDDPLEDAILEGLERPPAPLLAARTFDACSFIACDLTEGSLRGAQLLDCRFERCELSLVDLAGARLQGVVFDGCRLQGVDFGELGRDPMGTEVRFEGCDLSYASFTDLELTRCAWRDCRLVEARFERCDLRGAPLGGDLTRATFERCDLRGADLRAARDYRIDPATNRLQGMRVTLPHALGLLAGLGVALEG